MDLVSTGEDGGELALVGFSAKARLDSSRHDKAICFFLPKFSIDV